MDVPDPLLDRGDDRLHVGGGERVHEVDADRRDDLLGAEMHREQTVRPLDARMAARARNMATTPSRIPMPMDAAPSSTGRPKVSLAAIPARAIITPISAAVSSNRTMNIVGSLL